MDSKNNILKNKQLLPYGFHDHIFDEAEAEIKTNNIILGALKNSGFKIVRPSIIEFEESLDPNHSPDFFKVTDPISGKMMALRSDITPQIARIIRDKFSDEYFKGETIKISYTGQVFRKNPLVNSSERQLTQTGFEIVAKQNISDDVFAIEQAIEIFKKLKLTNYTINFVYPSLLEKLVGNNKNYKKIKELVEIKDYLEIKKLNADVYKLCKISDNVFDIKSAIKAVGEIEKIIGKNKIIKEILDNIKKIINNLSKLKTQHNISFDLFETSGFSYHSGLCYNFISNKTFEEIGRGGRYEILAEQGKIDAVGFTFLVNSLNRAV